ncbi:hypothetical protein BU23DRAFT_552414 [Bimuria novae-zelandiae CBS 107.79]|uniref:Uncharacterized protein n=1 Tax=Bimuria novae-zelandiae CBS 107.79 TaxID=1447943 RepID=A0A6A5VD80_9PLEO|nr:hypothetical protein BU23DRAFT_552414 [Bimuria novae-zelandiae CBS 107.79]
MRPTTRGVRVTGRSLRHTPNVHTSEYQCPRQFSQRPPRLLLLSDRSVPRPQLPFLYPSGAYPSNAQFSRLFSISANQKKFIKETARESVKWSIIIFIGTSCFSIASFGFMSERQERAFPSPHEWSLITRIRFRRGKWWQVPENNEEEGFTNWARVYEELEYALKRLEDPDKDGAGLQEQEKGGILVPGVGKAGFDISAKSEEWCQGYYEVLHGMALAAERLEGWVTTNSRRYIWAPAFVPSPDNPRPKATLPSQLPIPDENERIPASDVPETFYLKILTSKGFTTSQRMSAALGYADWLAFKKLPDSAEEMYKWALDIAISGLPTPNPTTTIDPKTAILSSTAPKESITENIVYAATNLATFHASQGNTTAALPILVSLLRARLNADPAPPKPPPKKYDSSFVGTLVSLLQEPEYPPVPPTGDEPLLRRPEDRCEEAALKSYIGEILFALAKNASGRAQGLAWVRDAVSTAKVGQSLPPMEAEPELRKKCETCEEVGLEAWGKIMTYLAAEAREKRDAVQSSAVKKLWWGVWPGAMDALEKDVEDKEGEEGGVVMRLNKLRSKMLKEELREMDKKYARTFVF